MGKYEPLARYLATLKGDSWTATFAEVESKLGFTLPRSAYEYPAWWSNQKGSGHSQKEGWQSVGWETGELDLGAQTVRFARLPTHGVRESQQPFVPSQAAPDLWERARALTGIDDRAKLEEHVLSKFLRHEAGKRLIALGGTMPDAQAPPRSQFD